MCIKNSIYPRKILYTSYDKKVTTPFLSDKLWLKIESVKLKVIAKNHRFKKISSLTYNLPLTKNLLLIKNIVSNNRYAKYIILRETI